MLVKILQSTLTAAICSVALLGLASASALAQVTPTTPVYQDPYCGAIVNGVWVSNGNCGPVTNTTAFSRVSGTIIFVRGHLVTLQQADRQLVINDQPALDMQATGRVAVGRAVEAIGYWRNGTFYATQIETTTQ